MSGTFLKHGALVESTATTVASGGTTTLVATSPTNQQFTGTSGQTIVLPNATTMSAGRVFRIFNRTTAVLTVKYNDGTTTLTTIVAGAQSTITLIDNGTSNGTWDVATSTASTSSADSAMVLQAYCFADSTGTPVGCSDPTVVSGKTRVTLDSAYSMNVTPGTPNGALRVYINGQKIPRYVDATLTPNASYTEVTSTIVDLDRDYSAYPYSIEIYQEFSVVDTSTQNSTDLMYLKGHKFRNLIINGAFDLWQRVIATTTSISSTTPVAGYTADRWRYSGSIAGGLNFTMARNTSVPTVVQSGFLSAFSLRATITGFNDPSSGEFIAPFQHFVEGNDFRTVHQKQATLSFWVRTNVPGTYPIAFQNNASDRSYVTEFTVNAGNTWEFKSVTLNLDTSGTWLLDSGIGIKIYINAYGGNTLRTSTANAWQAGNFLASNTVANFWGDVGDIGDQMQLTQVSFVGGPGVGATGFFRAGDSIAQEIELCCRFYEKTYDLETKPGTATTANIFTVFAATAVATTFFVSYNTRKRIIPVVTLYSYNSGTAGFLHDGVSSTDVSANAADNGQMGTGLTATPTGANHLIGGHMTVDAEY